MRLEHFDGRMFSTSDVPWGKPAPDVFLLAARTFKAAVENSVVVEDSLPGVKGGIAAGMTVYGYIAHDEGRRAGLHAAGALVFNELSELPQLLGLE